MQSRYPRTFLPATALVAVLAFFVASNPSVHVRADEWGCASSSEAENVVFSTDAAGKDAIVDYEECHVDKDYHPFPVQPYKIRSGWLRELSGIARSGRVRDVYWGHNDGKVNDLFAMRLGDEASAQGEGSGLPHALGNVIARAHLPTEVERQTDWEDIDAAACPDGSGRSCLWVADTGDNSKRRNRPRIHVTLEPDLDLAHPDANKDGSHYEMHVCSDDVWTFQFEFEYKDDFTGAWVEGGSFDVEAMVVAPQGDRFWLFEKKQHWEDNAWGWPRIFESDDVSLAIQRAAPGAERFQQITVREIAKFPRACEQAPEAWDWLAQPENAVWAERIMEDEMIASKVYKYKKLYEYGDREGLRAMLMNGTDCTSFPPIFWMITGANLHPTGRRLAIQTYAGAFEYTFETPLNLTELAHIKPRQLGLPRFDQIESVCYSHDGLNLYAIPEAYTKKGWQTVERIRCVRKPQRKPALMAGEGEGEGRGRNATSRPAPEEVAEGEVDGIAAVRDPRGRNGTARDAAPSPTEMPAGVVIRSVLPGGPPSPSASSGGRGPTFSTFFTQMQSEQQQQGGAGAAGSR